MKRACFKYGFIITLTTFLFACDAWQEDIKLNNQNIGKNLFELIASKGELSTFTDILTKTGYDKFLQEEQALTVFAPKNDVLAGVDLTNTDKLKEWIKNYIAYYSYYTNVSGSFNVENIKMINDKDVPVNAAGISGAGILTANQVSSNGVLHIIDNLITDRKNIWEYLLEQTGYNQIDFIKSINERVMDMEKSVQNGVDRNGRPIYDTVWVVRNDFLDTYPLQDETKAFTILLLKNNAMSSLSTKYAKYMKQANLTQQNKTINLHIAKDMILRPIDISQTGRYESVSDLLVDVDIADIADTYQASNGKVYILNDVGVKMYENKIKTQLIEAEDYVDRWDGQEGWIVRYRPWASGGKDVVLKAQTRTSFSYLVWDATNKVVTTRTETKTFNMINRSNEGYNSRSNNAYLKFEPEMYSIPYNIYWKTYDDRAAHISSYTGRVFKAEGGDTIMLNSIVDNDTLPYTLPLPMKIEQKMLFSFPGNSKLRRESDGTIVNNFTSYSVMATESIAGVNEELKLTRYRAAASDNLFMLATSLTTPFLPYTAEDDFGQNDVLKCPSYGNTTIFVSNAVREKDANAGIVFLDYIRLVPLVDPNE